MKARKMKYKKGTFVVLPNISSLDRLPAACQAIYVWLCKYADDDGQCFPSRKKLAGHIDVDMRTVDKHLLLLEQLGLIKKTFRKKGESQTSNMYQILILGDEEVQIVRTPCEVIATPPREENVPLTIPTTNSTQITKVLTTGQLPEHRGKSYVLRVLSVYRDLFRSKYSAEPTVDIGRFGKSLKTLMESKTELQIAALLITYFNWYGMTGSDQFEHDKLLKATFNPFWFFSSVTSYEIYLRNVFGLEFDIESAVRTFVAKSLLEMNSK